MINKLRAKVLSKSPQTANVEITLNRENTLYGKGYSIQRKFLVHDGKNLAQVGQEVLISPCRPQSKRKSWQIIEVIK